MPNLLPFVRRRVVALGHDPETFPPIRWARRLTRYFGFDIQRFGPLSLDWALREALVRNRVMAAIDIGGNRGQFGLALRDLGFEGRIHSFEPLPVAHAQLSKVAATDGNWVAHRCALGCATGTATLNVGRFDQTSSLKSVRTTEAEMNDLLSVVDQVEVKLDTLDHFVARESFDAARTFVKLDVQGGEVDTLRGGLSTVAQIPVLLVETSILSTYADGGQLDEVLGIIRAAGLKVAALRPVYANPKTYLLMEIDILAIRG